jgi:hypothetical protein
VKKTGPGGVFIIPAGTAERRQTPPENPGGTAYEIQNMTAVAIRILPAGNPKPGNHPQEFRLILGGRIE